MRSGALQEEIREALLDAFRQAYQMEIVVSNADIGTTFANYLAVPGTTYEQAMFNLLIWAESQDKLVPFLKAAQASNPGNPRLKAVMAKFAGLEARFGALRPDVGLGEAERIVLKGVKFEDVGVWIDTLARARWAICRVEPQLQSQSTAGYGTGYLVAPDVVMTNFHVAKPFWADKQKAGAVVLRFGYETGTTGVAVSEGVEHKLATSWRGPAGAPKELTDHPWQVLSSSVDALDFALLRLEKPAGDDVVNGSPRSLLTLTARGFNPTDPILILQHPQAAPLKLSFGAVEKLDPPNHVLYVVNTDGGSSGSPCLTQDLKTTAIHHYGQTSNNRGVTHEAILAFFATKRDELKTQGLERLIS